MANAGEPGGQSFAGSADLVSSSDDDGDGDLATIMSDAIEKIEHVLAGGDDERDDDYDDDDDDEADDHHHHGGREREPSATAAVDHDTPSSSSTTATASATPTSSHGLLARHLGESATVDALPVVDSSTVDGSRSASEHDASSHDASATSTSSTDVDIGRQQQQQQQQQQQHQETSNSNNSGSNKCSVYVGNLPYSTTWQELKDHMKLAGNVIYVKIFEDLYGDSKGAALVQYSSPEEALVAIQTLHNTKIQERFIFVREDREPSPSSATTSSYATFDRHRYASYGPQHHHLHQQAAPHHHFQRRQQHSGLSATAYSGANAGGGGLRSSMHHVPLAQHQHHHHHHAMSMPQLHSAPPPPPHHHQHHRALSAHPLHLQSSSSSHQQLLAPPPPSQHHQAYGGHTRGASFLPRGALAAFPPVAGTPSSYYTRHTTPSSPPLTPIPTSAAQFVSRGGLHASATPTAPAFYHHHPHHDYRHLASFPQPPPSSAPLLMRGGGSAGGGGARGRMASSNLMMLPSPYSIGPKLAGPEGASVYFGNLSWSTRWQGLKDYIANLGFHPIRTDIITNETGRSKGTWMHARSHTQALARFHHLVLSRSSITRAPSVRAHCTITSACIPVRLPSNSLPYFLLFLFEYAVVGVIPTLTIYNYYL